MDTPTVPGPQTSREIRQERNRVARAGYKSQKSVVRSLNPVKLGEDFQSTITDLGFRGVPLMWSNWTYSDRTPNVDVPYEREFVARRRRRFGKEYVIAGSIPDDYVLEEGEPVPFANQLDAFDAVVEEGRLRRFARRELPYTFFSFIPVGAALDVAQTVVTKNSWIMDAVGYVTGSVDDPSKLVAVGAVLAGTLLAGASSLMFSRRFTKDLASKISESASTFLFGDEALDYLGNILAEEQTIDGTMTVQTHLARQGPAYALPPEPEVAEAEPQTDEPTSGET